MFIPVVFLITFLLSNGCHCVPDDTNEVFPYHDSFYDLDFGMRDRDLSEGYSKRYFYSNRPYDSQKDLDSDFARERGNSSGDSFVMRKPRRFPLRMRRPFFRRRFPTVFPPGYRPMYVPYPMPYYYHP